MCHKQQNEYDYNDKLSFIGEWFDYDVSFKKNFLINFYPFDNTVEMYDTELQRIYLKRAMCDGVELKDMFIGNKIRIYARQILITDYADCYTQKKVGKTKEHTFAIIKTNAVKKLGEIINRIEENQFQICRLKMCNVTRKESLSFYEFKKGDPFLPFMIENLVAGPIVALELVGDNAIERWRTVIGPRDPAEARKTAPESLRAIYGMEMASNGFHGSDSHEDAVHSASFFFPKSLDQKPPVSNVQLENCTCCVIKPHAIEEGKLGGILTAIIDSDKFKITAMQMFYLTTPNADEYLEVYKGVVTDFHALLLSFIDGPCIALEIAAKREGVCVHDEFRQFAGPSDSDIARQIRPNSLRGMFGVSKYKNAVHCTDLAEDTELELEYFFKILKD